MSENKQPLGWDSPVIMMEGDATVARFPENPLTDPADATAAATLLLRTTLSIAVSLRRLADQLAPDANEQPSGEIAPAPEPAAQAPTPEECTYPESYWAQDLRNRLISGYGELGAVDSVVDKVLGALHQSLTSEGYVMSHIGPSLKTQVNLGGLSSPPPIPAYALRALMSLAGEKLPVQPQSDPDGLVHVLAMAVRGLRSVLATNQRGYLDGVHRAQAEYALSLYRDQYPESQAKPPEWDGPNGLLVP